MLVLGVREPIKFIDGDVQPSCEVSRRSKFRNVQLCEWSCRSKFGRFQNWVNIARVRNDDRARLVELLFSQEEIDKPCWRGRVARRISLQQIANEGFLRLPRRTPQKLLCPSRQCSPRPSFSKQRSSKIACHPNSCIHEEASARQTGQASATRRALQPSCLARPGVGASLPGIALCSAQEIRPPWGNPRGP